MSSSAKTEKMGLNQWQGTDVPKRNDFNTDDQKIEDFVTTHTENTVLHTTQAEKNVWNNVYSIQTFFGNNANSRVITCTADFTPRVAIVFAHGYTPQVVDIANESDYNYFGIATNSGSMFGVSLSGKNLTVNQSTTALSNVEYRNLNLKGVMYVCIFFR